MQDLPEEPGKKTCGGVAVTVWAVALGMTLNKFCGTDSGFGLFTSTYCGGLPPALEQGVKVKIRCVWGISFKV